MESQAFVELDNVSFRCGHNEALHGVSFKLGRGGDYFNLPLALGLVWILFQQTARPFSSVFSLVRIFRMRSA